MSVDKLMSGQTVWDRLHQQQTKSCLRKSSKWSRFCPEINDYLDVVLKASYDHHIHFDASKADVVKLSNSTKFGLRCDDDDVTLETVNESDEKYKKVEYLHNYLHRKADDPHLNISGRGFSRKPDGSFFKYTNRPGQN
ncbi:hypothetical protein CHUAL_002250 [Chamberlinius hualienensis]